MDVLEEYLKIEKLDPTQIPDSAVQHKEENFVKMSSEFSEVENSGKRFIKDASEVCLFVYCLCIDRIHIFCANRCVSRYVIIIIILIIINITDKENRKGKLRTLYVGANKPPRITKTRKTLQVKTRNVSLKLERANHNDVVSHQILCNT